MAALEILQIFQKRLRRLRAALVEPEKTARQKARLHQLRVEMKKWRAGLRLLAACDPAFPYPQVYKPFKILFADAGKLRFWQLQQHLLEQTPQLPPTFARQYGAYIRLRQREALKDFRKTAGRADLPKWRELKAEFRQSCSACTPAAVQAYFEALQKDITNKEKNLSRRRAGDLHDLRKCLKEYANNRQATAKHLHFDPGPPAGLPPDHAAFDGLLGQWHDQDVACVQLAEDLRAQGWTGEMLNEGKTMLRAWKRREREMWEAVVGGIETGDAWRPLP